LTSTNLTFLFGFQDGLTATSALRAGGFRNLIIGLTGNALDEEVALFLAAGADLVLSKPLKIDLLQSLVARLPSVGYISRPEKKLRLSKTSVEWVDRDSVR